MSDVGKPMQNGLVERFIRTLKEELVDYSEYDGFEDAYRQIAHWLEGEYMTRRLHSRLGYRTPLDFEGQRFSQASYPLLNQLLILPGFSNGLQNQAGETNP